MASTILDLPDPLGPIIPFNPSFIDIEVSSENDLNPDILNLLIYKTKFLLIIIILYVVCVKKEFNKCSL